MSTEKPDILHLRIAGSAKSPLKAIAAYHRRSQANTVAWLIAEEYRRLVKSGELKESERPSAHPYQSTPSGGS